MPTKQPVTTLILSEDLRNRIEDYWHKNRLPNRAEAIRQILEKGLKQFDKERSKKKTDSR
jgi:metal-responsive CopG/Arc/MetJ family transcriptional regulator